MSNYHGQIMNLPATPPPDVTESPVKDIRIAYKTGHRDARHAAAELAIQADARIEELEQLLKERDRENLRLVAVVQAAREQGEKR